MSKISFSKRWLLCALLSALTSLAAMDAAVAKGGGGGGGGGGGRGGARTTIIIVPGGAAAPIFRGKEASMILEVTDDAASAAEGSLKPGAVVAVHTLRSADAIVLTETAKGRRREVPAGTVLVRVQFADPTVKAAVWCDIRPTNRVLWLQEHDCFEDTRGAGRLDKIWEADMGGDLLGFSLNGVGDYNETVATPAAYRPAVAAERPRASLGFKYCDGDGLQSPPRFAMVVTAQFHGDPAPLTGSCRFGVWADDAKRTVDLGFMKIAVTPAAGGGMDYRLASRMEPARLASLYKTGDIHKASDVLPADQQIKAAAAARRLPLLSPTGGAVTISWGAVKIGQVFASFPVKHAVTGVLLNRVATSVMGIQSPGLEIGQSLFEVPAAGFDGDHLAWCAPVRTTEGLRATCLHPTDIGYMLTSSITPGMAPSLPIAPGFTATSAPAVRLQPVDFMPMVLTYKLTDVTMDNAGVPAPVFHVELELDWGDGPQRVGRVTYEIPPNGRPLQLGGAPLVLKHDGMTLIVDHPAS